MKTKAMILAAIALLVTVSTLNAQPDRYDGRDEGYFPGPDIGYYPRLDYRHGHFYDGPMRLSREDIFDYIGYTEYGSQYVKSKRQLDAGLYLTSGGAALLLTGIIAAAAENDFNSSMPDDPFFDDTKSSTGAYAAMIVGGVLCLGGGIPLLVIGDKGQRRILDDYSRRYRARNGYDEPLSSLTLGQGRNGVGFIYSF